MENIVAGTAKCLSHLHFGHLVLKALDFFLEQHKGAARVLVDYSVVLDEFSTLSKFQCAKSLAERLKKGRNVRYDEGL